MFDVDDDVEEVEDAADGDDDEFMLFIALLFGLDKEALALHGML